MYVFGNGGNEKIYIGSADWMKRNLSHRIEVITPILDADVQKTLRALLDIQLNDTAKARIIDKDQNNHYVSEEKNGERAQLNTYHYFEGVNE